MDSQRISNIFVLIPAYEPTGELVPLAQELAKSFTTIVIDDGSSPKMQAIFSPLEKIANIVYIRHAVNQGKGRAIKTGINYVLLNHPGAAGVITVDADGQHRVEDVLRVADTLKNNTDALVIGTRAFDRSIPTRSYIGNILTRQVFKLITGKGIHDTQSGLRGIPSSFMRTAASLAGEKYEYEINMLLTAVRNNIVIREPEIRTIYIEHNASSHFNPIFDSFLIYFVLLRFGVSSASTSLIDLIVFTICLSAGLTLLPCVIFSRIVAGTYNFHINYKYVFKSHENRVRSFIKYWILVAILACASILLISSLQNIEFFLEHIVAAKIVAEIILFFVSFSAQQTLIFRKTRLRE